MEKLDILVKGCPVPIHNMFNGYCSLSGKSISEGIIDAMIVVIEKSSGENQDLQAIAADYRGGRKK